MDTFLFSRHPVKLSHAVRLPLCPMMPCLNLYVRGETLGEVEALLPDEDPQGAKHTERHTHKNEMQPKKETTS